MTLPSLFGTDGKEPTSLGNVTMLARMCVSAEFAVFASNGSSPTVDGLRDFCKTFAGECGGPIGVIGLCITGGFALSLVLGTDGLVRAPVMSEPSLLFPRPFSNNQGALHLTPEEQATLAAQSPQCVALRFTGDYRCRQERFDGYQRLLGGRLVRIEILSPDKQHNITGDAHSVLTNELSDTAGHPTWAAFERVIEFLTTSLS